MRFIMVGADRLNVYLSKYEAEQENISIEKMANETYNIKQKLKNVFGRALESTGFDCFDTKLKIEFVPLIEGDILISIVKIGGDKTEIFLKNRTFVFEFENFDILAEAVACIQNYYTGRESVYKYKNKYFLIVYVHKIKISDVSMLKLKFLEYGFESLLSHLILREHGQEIICGNAGEIIKKEYLKK